MSDRRITTNEEPEALDETVVEAPADKTSTEADSDIESDPAAGGWSSRLRGVAHPATLLTLAGVAAFTIVFGRLGVTHYQNFGSWSFDMGIYDQGFWLVSRGGQSFITVRGLELWGHHVNLVALLFVPFYWLGAGPSFLYVAQAFALGSGRAAVYLIARDRFERPWVGVTFAAAYLMYAPIQWITSANFILRPTSSRRSCSRRTSPDGGRGPGTSRGRFSHCRLARTRRWPCSCWASCAVFCRAAAIGEIAA